MTLASCDPLDRDLDWQLEQILPFGLKNLSARFLRHCWQVRCPLRGGIILPLHIKRDVIPIIGM